MSTDDMSLRDYFAAKAMQGDLTAMQIDSRRFGLLMAISDAEGMTISRIIANEAYEMADAMLAARKMKIEQRKMTNETKTDQLQQS